MNTKPNPAMASILCVFHQLDVEMKNKENDNVCVSRSTPHLEQIYIKLVQSKLWKCHGDIFRYLKLLLESTSVVSLTSIHHSTNKHQTTFLAKQPKHQPKHPAEPNSRPQTSCLRTGWWIYGSPVPVEWTPDGGIYHAE